MTAFLMYDPRPVYLTLTGEVAAGGSLQFFAAGTTTPQDVYGDSGLTVNNGSTLTLGSDGRTSVEVWGDASLSYRVQLYDENGALVFDQDDVAGASGGGSTTIPTLRTGQFLTNDGSQLLWADIRQLPDPTGQAGKVLSTDGTNFTWIAKPADGAPGTNANVTVSSGNGIKIGGAAGDDGYIQWGTGSAPASGGGTTSVHTAFPSGFKSLAAVLVIPTDNPSGSGSLAVPTVTAKGTTGFDTSFSLDDASGNTSIINPVTFDWVAFGTVAGS
jgi:hypothetical protein